MKSRRMIIRLPANEPVLWVIDSEQWPRACLRAELIDRGYNPYGFIRPGDALGAFSLGKAARPEALILELRGQNLNENLIQSIQALKCPTILLGGNAELNDPLIRSFKPEIIFRRPFSLGNVADAVDRLCTKGPRDCPPAR